MSNWYVIWVLTGQEERVLRDAQATPGIEEALVPMQELPYRTGGAWETRRSVMIPGYVFVRCGMDAQIYRRIRGVTHVIGWLGPDSMWPTDVPDDEMERVKKLSMGCDPSRILENVKLDGHKRRGRGTLQLCGKEQSIVFPYQKTEHKQPDEARVDERPAADEGEQIKDAGNAEG